MLIYSKKIIRFLNEIKETVRTVLSKEVGLKVVGDRFYDHVRQFSYPIKIVLYNNQSTLGYFDSNFYEIGFHECLMHAREKLSAVIRHEVAHYLTFITYGETLQPHSAEFRALCHKLGWGEEVYRATMSLEVTPQEESGVGRKVKKLLALATSSNKHEAEQAMIKSQQLLLKHHLEYTSFEEEEEKIFIKRLLKQKKIDAKMRAIATILSTFFVSIVYKRAGEYSYLEILGNAVNIEIAEYVADVLFQELDNLWNRAQECSSVRGLIAKNSFFYGLAKGYCNKIHALKKANTSHETTALMLIEKKLNEAKAIVYPRLSRSRSSGIYCQESSLLGEEMGRHLNIPPALKRESKKSEIFIAQSSSERTF